jgi:hypothetical protein
MRGSIIKRGRSWAVVVEVGRDPTTGKRIRKWHSGYRTKRDAERARTELLSRRTRPTASLRSSSSQLGDHADARSVAEDGVVGYEWYAEPAGGRGDPAIGLVMLLAERVTRPRALVAE